MKKSTLLNYLMWGYQANMDATDYDELKKKLLLHEKESKPENVSKLAESAMQNFPEFKIMHQSFMRSRLDKISNGVNTIKIIAIIYLVASIIGAIAVLSQLN